MRYTFILGISIGLNVGFLIGDILGTKKTEEKINFDKFMCHEKQKKCMEFLLGGRRT